MVDFKKLNDQRKLDADFSCGDLFKTTPHGWFIEAPDMTVLMSKSIRAQLDMASPDAVLNIETHLYDVHLRAESCDYQLDVGKELWLNKGRWSRLTREYVPLEPLERFVGQAQEIMAGESRQGATANMLFRDPDRHAKKHRWGGCLMGATFRGSPKDKRKSTLTFFSRTTYMGYMALLDAAIAHCIAQKITEGDVDSIAFEWIITSQQLHCFKTLPYIFSQPDLMAKLEVRAKNDPPKGKYPPTWYHIIKWYRKVLDAWDSHGTDMLNHEKYGPFKRIKRRWMEHMGYSKKNLPPTLMVSDLDFSKSE